MANETSIGETAADDGAVRLVREDGYAIITLDRPHKRNAINRVMREQFRAALDDTRDLRAVVVTGVDTSFCAGVDLVERYRHPERIGGSASQDPTEWRECLRAVRRHPAVFIAAVNGFALGGGSSLVNTSELAVASERAEIGTPEVGYGHWPGFSGAALTKRVLPKHAAQLIFLARRVNADTALRMGIVNEVVGHDALLPRAVEIAERIASFDAVTIDWGKRAYHEVQRLDWEDAMEYGNLTNIAIANRRTTPVQRLEQFIEGTGRLD